MDIVERLVTRAVAEFGATGDGLFNSAGFGVQVKKEFALESAPDGRWVADVLSKLPYVKSLGGGLHWAYRPVPKSRRAEPAAPGVTRLSPPYDMRD